MALLVGKAHEFVLNGGAITGAGAGDMPRIHGRTADIVQDNGVGVSVGVDDVAGDLLKIVENRRIGVGREGNGILLAGLNLQGREVDGLTLDPRRRPGFEAHEGQS